MGRKRLSYGDAVKLLGGESPVIAVLGKLAGAGLTVLSAGGLSAALSLFELKDEVGRLSQDAVAALRKRLTGLNRFRRSELLEAAHAVLVVSAFFAALDDLDAELRTTLNSASLELARVEQSALAAGSPPPSESAGLADLARELILPGAIPGLEAGIADRGGGLKVFYAALAQRVRKFAAGTAVWEERDETTRDRWSAAVRDVLPERALARYAERLGQLSGDFPEFAFWAHRVGVQVVLQELYAARQDTTELGAVVRTLAGLMASAACGADPNKVRSDLVARYRNQLAKPIAGAGAELVSDEVTLPALQEIYVNPSYRTLPPIQTVARNEGVTESSWREVEPRADLWAMVLEHLISTEAARVPLVLLGQPGAGKSVFTQMLAAELDPRDYLVVRVELRVVPSDADIQKQIEAALVVLTGREIGWPELAEDAGDAQPVILLDGFDELLQASGLSHFDFLERVQAFQEREATLERPVAVLVTSRTAVANQVRYPDGTAVVRLEEFDDDQVGRWLATWNQVNSPRPLPVETALAQGELARQPLLLFLLALFHSGGGDLTPGISQAELYERLFTNFVERDVSKLDAGFSRQQLWHAVQRELDQLSLVAFAMFNRGRQMVTDADLVADLAALHPGQPGSTGTSRRTAALTIADRLAGRFFYRLFIQRDQAIRGQQATLSSYEFLHASFGEFLVARWVVGELRRLAEQARRAANDIYRQPPDDALLHALLSAALLSTREERMLDFIAGLLTGESAAELQELRALTGTLFHGCLQPRIHDPYPDYRPAEHTAPATYAVYSANLLLLMLLIAQAESTVTADPERGGLTVTELYSPGPASAALDKELTGFHAVARLWHAQLTKREWDSLLNVIRLRPAGPPDISTGKAPEPQVIRWTAHDRQQPLSGLELLCGHRPTAVAAHDSWIWLDDPAGRALREANLLGAYSYQDACIALLPYLHVLGNGSAVPDSQLGPRAAAMLTLLISPTWEMTAGQRTDIYDLLLNAPLGLRQSRLLLDQLRADNQRLPATDLTELMVRAAPYAWANITAFLDTIAHLHAVTARGQGGALDPFNVPRVLNLFGILGRSDLLGELRTVNQRTLGDLLDIIERQIDLGPLPKGHEREGLKHLIDAHPWEGFSLDQRARLDPRNRRDLRDLLNRLNPHTAHLMLSDTLEPFNLLGLLGLLDLIGPLDLRHRRNLTSAAGFDSLLDIALWVGMAQRGLPVAEPPMLSNRGDVESVNAMAPDFVARTRRLATERGYADPFST